MLAVLSQASPIESGIGVVLLIVAIGAYFLPTMVAGARGHRNQTAIWVLNIFLGWTFLGWVIALVWACTANTESD